MFTISDILYPIGFYRTFKEILLCFSDFKNRKKRFEFLLDIWQTNKQVANWRNDLEKDKLPKRYAFFISFTNLPLFAKFEGVLATSLRLQGYTPVVITFDGMSRSGIYHQIFGIQHIIHWGEWADSFPQNGDTKDESIERLLNEKLDVRLLKKFKYRGISIGAHALSKTSREFLQGRLTFTDPEVIAHLREKLYESRKNVDLAVALFEKYKPEVTFVRDPGYVPQGQIFEVGLFKGVSSIYYTFAQKQSSWIFKRYNQDNYRRHYFSLSSKTWARVKDTQWTDQHELELANEFSGHYNPISSLDTRRLQEGKHQKTPKQIMEQLGLNQNRKTAVIFSHITWDETLFFGTDLFDDFEDWLYQTTEYVSKNCPDVNWIIKEHPFNVFKLRREGVEVSSEKRLLMPLMPLPEHVRFVSADTEINTQSFFPLIDCVLTVNGTVGMEFPCFGVPAEVVIRKNVWIVECSIIMPGVTIGDHSIIGANSVVTGEIPTRVLAAGSPAKMIDNIKCDDDCARR